MKNSEILKANKELLSSLDKQRRYVMEIEIQSKPCPNCGTLHNLPEAAGVDFDDFDFSNTSQNKYRCRKCLRTLNYVLPLMGGWHWSLDYSEAEVKS